VNIEKREVSVVETVYICEKCKKEFLAKHLCENHEQECGCDHEYKIIHVFGSWFTVRCNLCNCTWSGQFNAASKRAFAKFLKKCPKTFKLKRS